MAVDASGNVYVGDTFHNVVKEIVAICGHVSSSSKVRTVGIGFFWPAGVAVDARGDIFVADTGNDAVMKIVAVKGHVSSASKIIAVVGGFDSPAGVAVNRRGDVFVADAEDDAVRKLRFRVPARVNSAETNVGAQRNSSH